MDAKTRANMDKVEELAKVDLQYRQMLQDMRDIERAYNAALAALSRQEQNAVCEFVAQCEEMSFRMLELACTHMEFRED